MKQVLWTSLFWILVIIGFAGVIRFVDTGEITNIKDFINEYIIQQDTPVCEKNSETEEKATPSLNHEEIVHKLDEIANKMDALGKNVSHSIEDNHHTDAHVAIEKKTMQKTYPTKEALLKAEPTCKTATDGVNTYFGKNLMASTLIGEPENFVPAWRCIDDEQATITLWKDEEKNKKEEIKLSQEEQFKAFLERQAAQQ